MLNVNWSPNKKVGTLEQPSYSVKNQLKKKKFFCLTDRCDPFIPPPLCFPNLHLINETLLRRNQIWESTTINVSRAFTITSQV